MSDKGKIIIGLIIFLIAVTYPVWRGMIVASGPAPVPKTPDGECVRDRAYMRANHMNILDQWRDDVVRKGDTKPVVINGEKYEKSLVKTCMKCHKSTSSNPTEFCDTCHNYADVKPYCWDCHVVRGGE